MDVQELHNKNKFNFRCEFGLIYGDLSAVIFFKSDIKTIIFVKLGHHCAQTVLAPIIKFFTTSGSRSFAIAQTDGHGR